jgi:hypothetical protein
MPQLLNVTKQFFSWHRIPNNIILGELIIDDENKKSLALFPVALFGEMMKKRTDNDKAT